MDYTKRTAALALSLLAGLGIACGGGGGGAAADGGQVAEGHKLFKGTCAICPGPNGEGAPSVVLPFGAWYEDREVDLSLPERWRVHRLDPEDGPEIDDAAVESAFAEPVGAPRLRELARGRSSAVVAVDDVVEVGCLHLLLGRASEHDRAPDRVDDVLGMPALQERRGLHPVLQQLQQHGPLLFFAQRRHVLKTAVGQAAGVYPRAHPHRLARSDGAGTARNRRPYHICLWCKERLGYVKPVAIDPKEKQWLKLAPIEKDPTQAFKIRVGNTTYYFECRARMGFDTDLEQTGLLIWKSTGRGIDLVEAHGKKVRNASLVEKKEIPFPSF